MLLEREVKMVPVQTFLEAAVEAMLGFSTQEDVVKDLGKGG